MRFEWLPTYAPLLLRGLWITGALTVVAGALGFGLAVLVGLGRTSRSAWINAPLLGFTSVIRGTPLLVQLYVLYYGLGSVFADQPWIRHSLLWPVLKEGIFYVGLALVLSTAGYGAEIVRAALLAVPKGELEAARAFGMSGVTTLRRVWLPRALGSILPTLAGESVMLLKSTALASMVTVMDLLGAANTVRARTYLVYEPLLLVASGYLVITLAIEQGYALVERRVGRAFRSR